MQASHDSFVHPAGGSAVSGRQCEDHAGSWELPGGEVLLVVSDGCSGSPGSSLGSRVLPELARSLLEGASDPFELLLSEGFASALGDGIAKALGLLGVCSQSMDATLVVALSNGSRSAFAVMGDGVLGWRAKGGGAFGADVGFADQAPPYPSYLADKARGEAYCGQTRGEGQVVFPLGLPDGLDGPTVRLGAQRLFGVSFEVEGPVDLVWVGSDGMSSVSGLSAFDLSFTDFKGVVGSFLRRRVSRVLKGAFAGGAANGDDFSMACAVFRGE